MTRGKHHSCCQGVISLISAQCTLADCSVYLPCGLFYTVMNKLPGHRASATHLRLTTVISCCFVLQLLDSTQENGDYLQHLLSATLSNWLSGLNIHTSTRCAICCSLTQGVQGSWGLFSMVLFEHVCVMVAHSLISYHRGMQGICWMIWWLFYGSSPAIAVGGGIMFLGNLYIPPSFPLLKRYLTLSLHDSKM